MNWVLDGVVYSPVQRAFDRNCEGELNWRARMQIAADNGRLRFKNSRRAVMQKSQ
jgi:hypothetical protein